MTEHLLLIDASAVAFRAFYTKAPRYRESEDGQPTGAIEVFLGMGWRMLGRAQNDNPTMGVAVFDTPGRNFRHDLFPAYKANRDPSRRLELDQQFPIMRGAAGVLGLSVVEKAGFEADDLIATLAIRAAAKGIRVTIVSSDKDFAQLVRNGSIEIVDPMARKRVLEEDVVAKFGVSPRQVPDVQALAGDAVDGIPGLKGCGMDTAAKLIRTFGDLDGVLANAKDIRFARVRLELKRRREGKTGAEWALLFHQLTTLRQNVPMGRVDFEKFRLRPIFKDDLLKLLEKLGASARAESILGLNPQMLRPAPALGDQFEWWREELEAPGQTLPDEPQCGFYQTRLQRGGLFVPARIWRDAEFDQSTDQPTGRDLLRCEIGGRPADPLAKWPGLSMKPITREQFDKMMKSWAPDRPPPITAPADLSKVKSIPNPARKKSHV